jgi:ribosomal protein S18 acetylase RimI-like enzyme
MANIIIRSYRQEDEAAVEEITFRTGFKGEDLTGRGFIDDKRLCFLMSIYYYVRYEPEHFFVAVDVDDDDAVVGFIGGTTDTRAQKKRFSLKIIPRIVLRTLFYTTWRYPQSFRTMVGMRHMADSLDDRETAAAIQSEYPAHLHINLLEAYQGQGIGTRLMRHFERHLIEQGVRGVHLGTTNHNHKAVPFYARMGFEIIGDTAVRSHPLLDDLRLLTFAKRLEVTTSGGAEPPR